MNLTEGDYELACKPGQTGKGIRTKISVTGSGGEAAKAPDREIEIKAVDYGYVVPSSLSTITAGQTIEFELENTGTVEHEFEVLGPDGKAVGEVGETEAGKTGKADITLTKSGTYTFRCGIEDHEKRGMKGTFVVP